MFLGFGHSLLTVQVQYCMVEIHREGPLDLVHSGYLGYEIFWVLVKICRDRLNQFDVDWSTARDYWRILQIRLYSLTVVGNEKEGGSERCQTFTICLWPRRSMFFSLLICCRLWFLYIRPSKAKPIGNVLTNRQNAAKRAQEICWRIKDVFGTDSDQNRITWGNPQKWFSDSLLCREGFLWLPCNN